MLDEVVCVLMCFKLIFIRICNICENYKVVIKLFFPHIKDNKYVKEIKSVNKTACRVTSSSICFTITELFPFFMIFHIFSKHCRHFQCCLLILMTLMLFICWQDCIWISLASWISPNAIEGYCFEPELCTVGCSCCCTVVQNTVHNIIVLIQILKKK